ncbi:TOTE conflict system archaeo-eukaryotic primase domain-containing protein [Phocaeicola plebeius]|jgi:superfamily II DNA or RNA helicase|uniref:Helicase n=1 Tax=Phocaeicola plebeius TaxID=310297 RepID=A0A415T5V3_9BACT|nr:DEAD/DEAH box helicase family protein [Phocaeicola plebeius]MBS4811116.1 DEAD/DEAH box helicase family protein [Bacteroides sp.]MBS4825125.1 DEAD/DEAH box helicase family protein [Bacteroides sp.]RHM97015.1 helicase [Phocaeicola plebeius]
MDSFQEKYNALVIKYNALLAENEKLKSILSQHGIVYSSIKCADESTAFSSITYPQIKLSLDEKIALFRNFFKGRDDVFARRWFNKATEKGGYQPVCINEWRRGICDKKKHKCAECPNRNFATLTNQDIYRHLEGKDENGCDVIGLYVVTSDNKCSFLCADFDDKNCTHGYKNDVLAFIPICREWRIPFSIERSRSGNGAHVWIFFDQPIPAYKARKLGNIILTEAMKRNGRITFDSYDRFFPNQDKVPEGGFGNLIALPLQGKARKAGNSVFVDDQFLPFQDQWTYLYNVRKIDEDTVDALLTQHQQEDFGTLATSSENKPWEIPVVQDVSQEDFNGRLIIHKSDRIYIPLKSISDKASNHLKHIAAFKNPEFYSKQAMRISTYNIPRIICRADFTDEYLAMPRGCEDAIIDMLYSLKIDYEIVNNTNHGKPIGVTFKGKERDEQLDAINALMPYSNGVLSATTAFGKTVTAAVLIARRKTNTLILVHSKALLMQWHERLSEFLDIDFTEEEISKKRGRKKAFSPVGCLDSTSNTLHGVIDIALMQSCFENDEVKPFVKEYGMVIVDECHHVSSITFENVLKHVTAHYVYGLTATPIRKDGLQPIIFMQCGPIRFFADAKAQIQKQSFQRYLVPRFTSYRPVTDDKQSFTALSQSLAESEIRNNLIIEDVLNVVAAGRTPIILTARTSHVELLAEMLKQHVANIIQLTGEGTAKNKRETLQKLQDIPKDAPLVIVATGKYVGEGFDYPRLDTLFLALPISWKGLVAQYAGRLHRENEGKKDVRIYDYIDIHEPVCENMYRKRLKGYSAIGYRVLSKDTQTLFDNTDDLQTSSYEGQIFNGNTFRLAFMQNLKSSRQSIVISSPKLYRTERNTFVKMLREFHVSGVQIAILTSEESSQTNYLKSLGLYVKIVPKLSLSSCIIDRSTVWYGSINILGYVTEEDNIIKITDGKLANELLDIMYDEHMNPRGSDIRISH